LRKFTLDKNQQLKSDASNSSFDQLTNLNRDNKDAGTSIKTRSDFAQNSPKIMVSEINQLLKEQNKLDTEKLRINSKPQSSTLLG